MGSGRAASPSATVASKCSASALVYSTSLTEGNVEMSGARSPERPTERLTESCPRAHLHDLACLF